MKFHANVIRLLVWMCLCALISCSKSELDLANERVEDGEVILEGIRDQVSKNQSLPTSLDPQSVVASIPLAVTTVKDWKYEKVGAKDFRLSYPLSEGVTLNYFTAAFEGRQAGWWLMPKEGSATYLRAPRSSENVSFPLQQDRSGVGTQRAIPTH